MPTLARALVQFCWMTYFALGLRQDLLIVQGIPVWELGRMMAAEATLMMLVCDVCNVSPNCTFSVTI